MKKLLIATLCVLALLVVGCEWFDYSTDPNVIAAFTPLLDGTTTVRIRNESTGATHFWWDSGDGQTSTLFEPHFNYPVSGTYLISLRACPGDNQGSARCDVAEQWVDVP